MRLIDADALLFDLANGAFPQDGSYGRGRHAVIEEIKKAPTIDAVQVVRCKECKHSVYDKLFRMRWCGGEEVNDDDFCSYGERENDEID